MKPTFQENGVEIYQGDCREVLRSLPDESVHCVVTSPPYWGLRDYGCEGQIGLEDSPVKYIATMREVFAEVRRVLRSDGTLWLNLGDSYAANRTYQVTDNKHVDVGNNHGAHVPAGLKPKDLVGIPWMLAFALREDGWYLRQDIIWAKPNPMPESVTDRCTKAHEYIFLLSKSERYYYNQEAVREPQTESSRERALYGWNGRTDDNSNGARTGSSFKKMAESGEPIKTIPADGMRNKRSVWEITTYGFPEAHFATFPEDLIKPCILAGCPEGGTVLDPFGGSGTTAKVARELHCKAILVELNPDYIAIAARRLSQHVFNFAENRAGGVAT